MARDDSILGWANQTPGAAGPMSKWMIIASQPISKVAHTIVTARQLNRLLKIASICAAVSVINACGAHSDTALKPVLTRAEVTGVWTNAAGARLTFSSNRHLIAVHTDTYPGAPWEVSLTGCSARPRPA